MRRQVYRTYPSRYQAHLSIIYGLEEITHPGHRVIAPWGMILPPDGRDLFKEQMSGRSIVLIRLKGNDICWGGNRLPAVTIE